MLIFLLEVYIVSQFVSNIYFSSMPVLYGCRCRNYIAQCNSGEPLWMPIRWLIEFPYWSPFVFSIFISLYPCIWESKLHPLILMRDNVSLWESRNTTHCKQKRIKTERQYAPIYGPVSFIDSAVCSVLHQCYIWYTLSATSSSSLFNIFNSAQIWLILSELASSFLWADLHIKEFTIIGTYIQVRTQWKTI